MSQGAEMKGKKVIHPSHHYRIFTLETDFRKKTVGMYAEGEETDQLDHKNSCSFFSDGMGLCFWET